MKVNATFIAKGVRSSYNVHLHAIKKTHANSGEAYYNNALVNVAKNNSVKIDVVKLEIEKAIERASSNPDPKIQAFWRKISSENNLPSPEDFIINITKMLLNKKLV